MLISFPLGRQVAQPEQPPGPLPPSECPPPQPPHELQPPDSRPRGREANNRPC